MTIRKLPLPSPFHLPADLPRRFADRHVWSAQPQGLDMAHAMAMLLVLVGDDRIQPDVLRERRNSLAASSP